MSASKLFVQKDSSMCICVLPGKLASLRVDHHHHDHGQLCRHGPRRQAFKQRQVDHVDQAGQIILLPLKFCRPRSRKLVLRFLICDCKQLDVTGGDGNCVHGGVHHRDVDQDPGPGLHAPQGQLHEKPLELHGLLRCHIWVS